MEEAVKGVEEIGGAGFGLDVFGSEEDLGDEDVEVGKQRAVGAHEAGLTDGGAGLAGGDIVGVFGEAHGRNSRTDGTRGNKQAAMTLVDEFGNGSDQMHQRCAVDGAIGGFGEDAGTGFDDGEIAGHVCGNCRERGINCSANLANPNLGKPSSSFLVPLAERCMQFYKPFF